MNQISVLKLLIYYLAQKKNKHMDLQYPHSIINFAFLLKYNPFMCLVHIAHHFCGLKELWHSSIAFPLFWSDHSFNNFLLSFFLPQLVCHSDHFECYKRNSAFSGLDGLLLLYFLWICLQWNSLGSCIGQLLNKK